MSDLEDVEKNTTTDTETLTDNNSSGATDEETAKKRGITFLRHLPADVWLSFFVCLAACIMSKIADVKLGAETISIDISSDGFKLFAVYIGSFLIGLAPISGVLGLIFNLVALKIPTKLTKLANIFTIMLTCILIFVSLSV